MSVVSGQLLTVAQLKALETAANACFDLRRFPIQGPFRFPPPILAIDDQADLIQCHQADTGEYPGPVVVCRKQKKAFQSNGSFRSAANWVAYPTLRVFSSYSEMQAAAAPALNDLAYLLDSGDLWHYTKDIGFFSSESWVHYSATGRDLDNPQTDAVHGGLNGIRGEMHRLWYLILTGTPIARNGGSSQHSYASATADKTYYSFTGISLPIREPWNRDFQNPYPIKAFADRYRNVIWAYDPATGDPDVRCVLTFGYNDGQNTSFHFTHSDLNPPDDPFNLLPDVHFRIINQPAAGHLQGDITVFVENDSATPFSRPPRLSDFTGLTSGASLTVIDHAIGPGGGGTYESYTLLVHLDVANFPGGEFFAGYKPDHTFYGDHTYDGTFTANFIFTIAGAALGNSTLIDLRGINRSGPLAGKLALGCGIVDFTPSMTAEQFVTFKSGDWDDVATLQAAVNLNGGVAPGCWLAVPAPLARADLGAQTDLNIFTFQGGKGRVPSPSLSFVDPAHPELGQQSVVSPAQLWRPPRWPVRQSEGDIRFNSPLPFEAQYAILKHIWVGRAPTPSSDIARLPLIADMQRLTFQIGQMENGIFKSWQSSAIPAGQLSITLEVAYPIFTADPLVYKCTEPLNVQPMIVMPDPGIVGFQDYQNTGNPTQSDPLMAFHYNNLLYLCGLLK